MFDIRAFEPGHFDILETNGMENPKLRTDLPSLITDGSGQAVSMFDREGRLILIGGFVHIFRKTVEVFIIPSIYIREHPVTVIRECNRFLDQLEFQYHRIQTLARADVAHDEWMMALRFVCEGTLIKYTDEGVNYRMWARVA